RGGRQAGLGQADGRFHRLVPGGRGVGDLTVGDLSRQIEDGGLERLAAEVEGHDVAAVAVDRQQRRGLAGRLGFADPPFVDQAFGEPRRHPRRRRCPSEPGDTGDVGTAHRAVASDGLEGGEEVPAAAVVAAGLAELAGAGGSTHLGINKFNELTNDLGGLSTDSGDGTFCPWSHVYYTVSCSRRERNAEKDCLVAARPGPGRRRLR